MRILVTGVTGQVGGALAARLPPSATVLAADRGSSISPCRKRFPARSTAWRRI